MKKLFMAIAVLVGIAGAALADPVEGVWKTQVDDGAYAYVTFAPCGDKLCGVISRTFNSDGEYKSENIGRNLVWDMVPKGNGKYGDGKIWQPSKDRVFSSRMTLSGDTLKVFGCIAGCLIRKSQTWTRVR